MLRAVSSIYVESQALAIVRRDVFKLFRTTAYAGISSNQTVLAEATSRQSQLNDSKEEPVNSPPPPPPPPPGPSTARRGWLAATAVALTASVGGVYFLKKLNNNSEEPIPLKEGGKAEIIGEVEGPPIPSSAEALPEQVDYLVVGAGTAAFAALRTLRSVRPEASVLLVGDERALPYMRPPLSKELWREPDLARRAADPDTLIFQQWNGKKRRLAYEPSAFYTPTEKLREGAVGAGVARGWSVSALDLERREATLEAPGTSAKVTYKKCLIATGARAKQCAALRSARAAGRALSVRSARDVARLAALLQSAPAGPLALLGGGAHACELAVSLAHALRDSGREVVQVFKESTPLAEQLPQYLGADLARRMAAWGVKLLPDTEVSGSSVHGQLVRLERADGAAPLHVALVVECVGSEPNAELAAAAGLEVHPQLGGVVVNAEMQARSGVWAAGDVACFHEPLLGRRREARHDHAVASARVAAANMAGAEAPRLYTHQPMLWTDLGPDLGLEAIGIIDSRLPTVAVFSADAVTEPVAAHQAASTQAVAEQQVAATQPADELHAVATPAASATQTVATPAVEAGADPSSRSYERGVVFYLREKRVVGVLLWNLFSRMHVARQVLKQGEFEDLFDVAKLFTPHED
ncbi:unnamed protein product, partial [Iphiclides podalirius]